MFDVMGLPLHPLVVHAVVVLLPLAAVGLVLCAVVNRWRARYLGLTVLLGLAGTVSAYVAATAGYVLAERVGLPASHQQLGDWLPRLATLTLVLAMVWYFLQRGKDHQPLTGRLLGYASGLAGIGLIVLTVLVGHSGATAVWAGSSATGAATTPASTTSASASYTMTQVQQHNTAADCWAAIDGSVYDLTSWVNQHPGGADRITALCGTDATAQFAGQHGSNAQAQAQLARLKIGTLA